MLCDGSQNICVYDSRGLSEVDTAEAQSILRCWLEKGVRHGQMVVRFVISRVLVLQIFGGNASVSLLDVSTILTILVAPSRPSDSSSTRYALECKARHGHHKISKKRNINFVIFVVNAVSLNNIKKTSDWASRMNLIKLYKSPFLSFTGDKIQLVCLVHEIVYLLVSFEWTMSCVAR